MTAVSTIAVKYTCINGTHFFTAGDEFSKGLCVANKNLEAAYEEVSKQLNYLLKINHGRILEITPAQPLSRFEEWLKAVTGTQFDDITTIPVGVLAWANSEPRQAA